MCISAVLTLWRTEPDVEPCWRFRSSRGRSFSRSGSSRADARCNFRSSSSAALIFGHDRNMVVDLCAMMDALVLESVLSRWERKTREHESASRRASTTLFIVVTTTTITPTIYTMAQEQYKDYLAARILAENKPVTYRLLSRALKTNVNTAKRLVLLLRTMNASSPQIGCSLSFTRRKMHASRSLFTPLIFSPVRLETANRTMASKSEKAKIPTCVALHS